MTEFGRDAVGMQFVSKAIYELEIQNYSQYANEGHTFVQSPFFKLLGRKWSLKIYTNGDNEEAKEYISVFLHNEEVDSEVKAQSTFVLVNQTQESDSQRALSVSLNVYTKQGTTNSGLGHRKYFKQSLLTDANSQFIVNDTVIFRVEISVLGDLIVPKCPAKCGPVLSDCINNLLMCGEGTDMRLLVGPDALDSARIPAHKLILMARSPVFKAMFTHNMSESNTNEIVVSDFSPEVIREMLHFMYTDKLQSETLDNTVYEGLLGAAIKYDVPGLINLCERHFCAQLTDDNVVLTFKMADACGSTELKAVCMSYIKKHSSRLMNSPNFSSVLEYVLSFAPMDWSGSVGQKRKAVGEL